MPSRRLLSRRHVVFGKHPNGCLLKFNNPSVEVSIQAVRGQTALKFEINESSLTNYYEKCYFLSSNRKNDIIVYNSLSLLLCHFFTLQAVIENERKRKGQKNPIEQVLSQVPFRNELY